MVYDEMHKEAEWNAAEQKYLWSGFKAKWLKERGITGNQYSAACDTLEHWRCIEQLRRGTGGAAGSSPTVIALIRHPNEVSHRSAAPSRPRKNLTIGLRLDIVEQAQDDFRRELNNMQGGMDIRTALRDLAQRQDQLGRQLRELQEALEDHLDGRSGQ